jgi:hypothetical protein
MSANGETMKVVTVNDRMQSMYRYTLVAPVGRQFDPEFTPELTPSEMLQLGVFCGKYMTDCANEFPTSWFTDAKLSPRERNCALNYFGVDASQPLSVWRKHGWIHPDDPRGWFQWYCLPVLHGTPHARRRRTPSQTMESDAEACRPNSTTLRAWRSQMPATSATSAPALGIR